MGPASRGTTHPAHGWDALRAAVMLALDPAVDLSLALSTSRGTTSPAQPGSGGSPQPKNPDDAVSDRVAALVDLARDGDVEAFGQLYDHYSTSIYRYCYYRVSSVTLAEDLTSETFFRALRSISSFSWQGRDFGAWLTTIARNLVTDHYKSSRTRLEMVADELPEPDTQVSSTEDDVLAHLTNQRLMAGLKDLSIEQRDCLVMRFLQGLSIAETAKALARSEGAIKQLQLRAVRNLAGALAAELR
ncbi:MAG: sigma-70 family RNA polymerase sigma factor [Nocardioidaceae bacterium]